MTPALAPPPAAWLLPADSAAALHAASMVAVMLALLAGSAFFSASEAAFFSLSDAKAAGAGGGGLAGRAVTHLLSRADRLLSAILFYNLTINITYFALSAILAAEASQFWPAGAWAIPAASLAGLLLLGELVPKSLGVAAPGRVSRVLAIPLSWAVAVAGPVTPILQGVCGFSRRLLWPSMRPEQNLNVTDLERAIELSGHDASLIRHEKMMLQNAVQLSVVRVEEWMRPRSSFPCVALHDDIAAEIEALLAREPGRCVDCVLLSSEVSEVAASVRPADVPAGGGDWRAAARPVLIAPWCQTLGVVFERMRGSGNHVALVVNEFGEGIGVLTLDDLIESVFCVDPSAAGGFGRPAFDQTGNLQWEVTGSTSLRRVERALGRRLPRGRHVTVAGVVQNELQRLPQPGDAVRWGGFHIEVCRVPRRGEMLLRMTQTEDEPSPART